MGNVSERLAWLGRRPSPLKDGHHLIVIHGSRDDIVSIGGEGHVLDAFSEGRCDQDLALHGLVVPDANSRLGSDLASGADLTTRVHRKAVDIIRVVHEVLLGILAGIHDNTDASCAICNLTAVRIPKIVATVMATEAVNIIKFKRGIRSLTIAALWNIPVWFAVSNDAHPRLYRHKLVTFLDIFGKFVAIFDLLALFRAFETLRVDLTVKIFIEGRHTACACAKVRAEILALGHSVAHEHLKDLLVLLDVVLELSEGDLVIPVDISGSEKLVGPLFDLIDCRCRLALHALQTGHGVGHQDGELVLADAL